MPQCPKCLRNLLPDEFYAGSTTMCKGCMTWQNLSYNAKKEGHAIGFTKAPFLTWYGLSAQRKCSYCSISESGFSGLGRKNPRGYHIQCLGVDRSDSSQGYTPQNARLACLICNRIKSNIFTPDEMEILGAGISDVWASRGIA